MSLSAAFLKQPGHNTHSDLKYIWCVFVQRDSLWLDIYRHSDTLIWVAMFIFDAPVTFFTTLIPWMHAENVVKL